MYLCISWKHTYNFHVCFLVKNLFGLEIGLEARWIGLVRPNSHVKGLRSLWTRKVLTNDNVLNRSMGVLNKVLNRRSAYKYPYVDF